MELIHTIFCGHHPLCVWLTAKVMITLIQETVIIMKESDALQAGRFLLELVELAAGVAVTNVVSIASRSPGREQGKE